MVTHFHVGTNHPIERLNLHVSSVFPLPKSYRDAFNDRNWHNAMRDEYIALIKNKTWTLVPRPPDRGEHGVDRFCGAFFAVLVRFAVRGAVSAHPYHRIPILCIKKYAIEILDRAHMDNCNPSQTPIDTESKLGSDGDPLSDPTLYQSLAVSSSNTDLVAYSDAD
ncbi:ribonuclease H-like domain-containing protein [Tanacetum coccineum]